MGSIRIGMFRLATSELSLMDLSGDSTEVVATFLPERLLTYWRYGQEYYIHPHAIEHDQHARDLIRRCYRKTISTLDSRLEIRSELTRIKIGKRMTKVGICKDVQTVIWQYCDVEGFHVL